MAKVSELELTKFLNLKTCKKINEKKKKAKFVTIDNKIYKESYITVADSAYDQTYKKLFTGENPINNINGKDRLKSLLNSLIFPEAGDDDVKVRDIEYLPNEKPTLTTKRESSLGILRFDVICRCKCRKKTKKRKKRKNNDEVSKDKKNINEIIFDVEMQTGYDKQFLKRFFKYGYNISTEYNDAPVIVLTFLNFQSQSVKVQLVNGEAVGVKSFLVNGDNTPLKLVEDGIQIYYFNLPDNIGLLLNNRPIKINNMEINKTGREWLKLLSIRQWAKEYYQNGLKRYILPKDLSDSDINVQSAIKILKCITDRDLRKYIDDEKIAIGLLQGAEEEGIIKGERNGIIKGERKKTIYMVLYLLRHGSKIDEVINNKVISEDDGVIINNFYNDPNRNITNLANELEFKEESLKEICNQLEINYIGNKNKKDNINPNKRQKTSKEN